MGRLSCLLDKGTLGPRLYWELVMHVSDACPSHAKMWG